MSPDHKSEGKKMQLMIKMRSCLPVKKGMMMTMMMKKVFLPKYNCSDERSPRSETTGKSESDTKVAYSLQSSLWALYTHQFHIVFQNFLSWLIFHILDIPVKILKPH